MIKNMIIIHMDKYNENILRTRFNQYKNNTRVLVDIIGDTGLPIRNENPPEDITENIVKFILKNKRGDTTCVWAKSVGRPGDLYSNMEHIQEVKAFTSDGPCSFGPKKVFHVIYFLDLREWLNDRFVLWRINLSSASEEWKKLKMNSRQTFEDHCNLGRRPHIGFDKIYEQLKDLRMSSGVPVCSKIYEGTFENIFINEVHG
jgi:hypothetical protein